MAAAPAETITGMSRRRSVSHRDRFRPLLRALPVWSLGAVAAFTVLTWRASPDAGTLAWRLGAVGALALGAAVAFAALTRVPPLPRRPRRQADATVRRTSASSWTPARKTTAKR